MHGAVGADREVPVGPDVGLGRGVGVAEDADLVDRHGAQRA